VGIDKNRWGWGLNNLIVRCYSGHTYAEEPRSFQWDGTEHEIEEIEKAWREPGEKYFQVRTGDNRLFKICYNEAEKRWTLSEEVRR